MKCYKCHSVIKWKKLFSFKLGQMAVKCDCCDAEIIKKEDLFFFKMFGSLLVASYLVLIKLFDLSIEKELILIFFLFSFFFVSCFIIFTRRLVK